MAKQLFANNAKGRLNAGITNVATSATLQAGQGALFPNPTNNDWFMATLVDTAGNIEVVKVTARSGDSITTMERAQEGTSNRAFSASDRFELRWTKGSSENVEQVPALEVIAGSDTLTAADRNTIKYCTAAGTISLMATTTVSVGDWVIIKSFTSSAVDVTPNGGDTIDGMSGTLRLAQYAFVKLVKKSDGEWAVLGQRRSGKETIWVPAGAMTPHTTSGASGPTPLQFGTNNIVVKTLDFDQATDEYAQFAVQMPKSWNRGTLLIRFVWTAVGGSGAVKWDIAAQAWGDGDGLDVGFGTAVSVTDTFLGNYIHHRSNQSSAMTVGGSPAVGDMVQFRVQRDANSAGDTYSADAKLVGLEITFDNDKADDS